MKKKLKWIGIILATPILLFVILTILLYIPPVQNWVARRVAQYASEQTGMEIRVGRVALAFPLDLAIHDFIMLKKSTTLPLSYDTIANVERLVADVQLMPLFKEQIEIDAFELNRIKVSTNDFIPEARIKGSLHRMYLESHGIDLKKKLLKIDKAQIEEAIVQVQLADSTSPDTTTTKNLWKIQIDQLDIDKSRVTVYTPGDTLRIQAYMGKASLQNIHADLHKEAYSIRKAEWAEGGLTYDNRFTPATVTGMDYNHIRLTELNIAVDSFYYNAPMLRLAVRKCSFKEKSGIHIAELTSTVALDSATVYLPTLRIRTPDSHLLCSASMDFNAFDKQRPGVLSAQVDAALGKADIMRLIGNMPREFTKKWPNQPLSVKGKISGNMKKMVLDGINLHLPTALNAKLSGIVSHLDNTDRMEADINLVVKSQNLSFIPPLLPSSVNQQVKIPHGMTLTGRLKTSGANYSADIRLAEGGGKVNASLRFNTESMAYNARINANSFSIQHFLPHLGASPFTGDINIKGVGTDFLSNHTHLQAEAKVINFRYGGYSLNGMQGKANIRNGWVIADLYGQNPLFDGHVGMNAHINKRMMKGTLTLDLKRIDLYTLRIYDEPLVISGCAHLDVDTDFGERHKLQGFISDLTFTNMKGAYRPEDMVLEILTRRDTTHAVVRCGDLNLSFNGSGGYKQLMKQSEKLMAELQKQLKEKSLNQERLRERLPEAKLYLAAGSENILSRFIKQKGYQFKNALIDLNSSAVSGLNGQINIDALVADSLQLDTIRLSMTTQKDVFSFHGNIRNNKKNPQYVFNALFSGSLSDTGADIQTKLYDANNRLGIDIGLIATMEHEGMRVRLNGEKAILGYQYFHINEDNYIFMGNDKRISARLMLKADDGTGVQVYTNDDNTEALQDLTVSLYHFNLGKLSKALPYLPNIKGTMNGDYHIIQTPQEVSVSSAMSISDMSYENAPMGNLSTEFVYMPKENGGHYIDGILYQNGKEVGTLVGTYNSARQGIDAKLSMQHMPLDLLNGMISDQIIGLKGYADGSVDIKGSLSRPNVDGEILLDSAYLVSVPYGVQMRFDQEPIRILNSHILFEDFRMYAYNKSALTINGSLNFSNLDNMFIDVSMRARNFQLIKAKESAKAEAYGSTFVNFFAMLRGSMDNMRMRGKLDVLGSTDMTYVLRDSPLTTDNRLEGLVSFVNFQDTLQPKVTRPPLKGFDMDLAISIDEGAHVKCDLNSDHTNYIDLIGGGELRMKSNAAEDLRLTGRYTLSNGEMKYSLPVIPLKTFIIQDGSYLEFTGEPMNPKLNITATERSKAAVSEGEGISRMVEFECGVVITKTLEDMGLEFVIDAPEDLTISSELNTMSKEERGKLAVTMLTTGMYMAEGNTSNFSMNSALSSFLQGEINQITGSALRTLDLSIGLDNTTDASGATHTDYSFKFSKRFWNNRLRIVVGGKVSSGNNDYYNQNESFFDNVTFEYRMSPTSNQYFKLFYDRNSYDWIEGNVGRYGAGFIWRRKLRHFKDIFKLKNESTPNLPTKPEKSKTIVNDTIGK